MIEVPLTSGRSRVPSGVVTLIDDADADRVLARSWRLFLSPWGMAYAMTGDSALLHRWLLDAPKGSTVEHRNKDGLDNTRHNLVLLSHSQHLARQRSRQKRAERPTSSRFKGVSRRDGRLPWRATISVGGRSLYLGSFLEEVEAAKAYDAAASQHFGEFANVNFPSADVV